MTRLTNTWNHLWDAIRTHPFEFFTLLFALTAIGISILAWKAARRQAIAGERQANSAEETLRLQAEALRSQAEDTERALAIAKENSNSARASAEALQIQAQHTGHALEIAKQSADAAERLAEANESLATSGQRGWLIVMSAQAAPDHAPEQGKVIVRAHFQFKNVGKTPIAHLRLRHCKRILATDPTDFVGLETVYEATLAPNGEVPLNPIYECTPAEFSKIKSRAVSLYFYGNAIYDDIFGHLRKTQWRWAFNGDELVACEEGNGFS